MKFLLYITLTVAFLLLNYHINKPFIGHHDWNGAFWGTVTKNYLYHTNQAIPFVGTQKETPFDSQKFIYYQNYTPLMPILFTISSLFFGVNELSLRLTTTIFSIIMLLYIYKIANLLYSQKVALLATILATVTPMFLYFGKLPDHEPIITSLITVTFYYYLKLNVYDKKTYITFLCLLTLVLLESWAGFIFLATLVLFSLFRKKRLKFFIMPIFLGILVIVFHLLVLYILYGQNVIINFFSSGIGRISAKESVGYVVKYNFLQFLNTEAHFFVIYFTRILTALTALWIIKFMYKLKNKHLSESDKQLLPLGVFAAVFIMIFNNLAFIHDYKLYLFLPAVAIASAQMLWTIFDYLPRFKHLNLIIAIFLILIVSSVFTERLRFLKTQLDTSFNSPGYNLGRYLKNGTPPESEIFVNSGQFHSLYDVFVIYYSNRSVTGYDLTLANFKKDIANSQYDYLVLVTDMTTDSALQKYLDKNYKSSHQKNFIVYDLSK